MMQKAKQGCWTCKREFCALRVLAYVPDRNAQAAKLVATKHCLGVITALKRAGNAWDTDCDCCGRNTMMAAGVMAT